MYVCTSTYLKSPKEIKHRVQEKIPKSVKPNRTIQVLHLRV